MHLVLECSHVVDTGSVEIRKQYDTDVHYVLCPPCRALKENDRERIPTAWRLVISDDVSDVQSQFPSVLPGDIMRVQSKVAPARRRPFPYVTRRGDFS